MFWYIEKPEDRPLAFLAKLQERVDSGEFEKLPKDEQTKIIKTAVMWDQAKGRYMYQPNEELYWWFLMPHWIKGIRGGNQSGKSSGCTMDFVMWAEGWHPLQKLNMERIIEETYDGKIKKWLKELYRRRLFLKDPPVKLRSATIDYTIYVNDIIGPEYMKWATNEMVSDAAYTNDKKRKIIWNNGSFVHFMTYEQSVLTHGGAARDGIQLDEEPPKGIWDQSKMRVSTTNGRLIVGMTAEQGVTWTEDEIWKPGLTHRHPTIYACELSTYDNPINSQAMIDRIKQSCSDDTEIAIRIYGKSTPRGGSVYGMAKDEYPWVIEPFDIPQDKGYLIMAIDPHPKVPHAVLWVWVDYEGIHHPLFMNKPYLYEVGELFEPCSIPELAALIKQKEKYEFGRTHDFVLCDQFAWNKDQNNPKTLADQFIEAGIMVTPATKDRDSGIVKVKEMLSLTFGKELPEDMEESVIIRRRFPQIMCFDTLSLEHGLRWERKKYRWRKARQRYTDDIAIVQKPVDKDDHFMENEYRIALFVVDGQFEIIEADEQKDSYKVNPEINGNKMDVDFRESANYLEEEKGVFV